MKGSSISVGPPAGFDGPCEAEVPLEILAWGGPAPFREMGTPRPLSMDWILRS